MTYKLGWLNRLRDHAEAWLTETPDAQIVLVSDWNVAPEDEDVWDIDFFEKNRLTHVTDEERAAFQGSWTQATRTWPAPTLRGPGRTRSGTTRACASRRGRACGSTFSSPPRTCGPCRRRVHRQGRATRQGCQRSCAGDRRLQLIARRTRRGLTRTAAASSSPHLRALSRSSSSTAIPVFSAVRMAAIMNSRTTRRTISCTADQMVPPMTPPRNIRTARTPFS